MEPADSEYEERRKAMFASGQNGFTIRKKVKVGDIPDTKFYEWDVITMDDRPEDGPMKVLAVEWNWTKDDEPLCYRVTPYPDGGYTTNVHEDRMTLFERGPVWEEEHGVEPYFTDAVEAASYESARSRVTEIRNPYKGENAGLYAFTLVEALSAVREGLADAISVSNIPFTAIKSTNVTRFSNREVGERVRAATLAGFPDDPETYAESDRKMAEYNESVRQNGGFPPL